MKRAAILGTVLALAAGGCGYHLRGSVPIEWHLGKVYVDRGHSPALANAVADNLSINGVALAATPAQADAVITLVRENYDRRVLSVDPQTGKVTEYEIDLNVGVKVTRPDGTVLYSDDSIDLQRDQTFEENAALSKFQAQTIIEGDLRSDAANVVMRRLQSVTGKPMPAGADDKTDRP